MKSVLCYVHLGENSSPTLIEYAHLSLKSFSNATSYLITDKVDKWQLFPGKVIRYSREDRNPFISTLARNFPELKTIAGGYWLNSFERLFALSVLENYIDNETEIIHLESDVILLMNNQILKELRNRVKDVATPVISENVGIASFVYAKNIKNLIKSFNEIANQFRIGFTWKSDMEFIALGQKLKLLTKLPTELDESWLLRNNKKNQARVIFDGATLGSFLFGRDPIHTNGKIIPGYIYPGFKSNLRNVNWQVKRNRERIELSISKRKSKIIICCLHMHCKLEIKDIKDLEKKLKIAINNMNTNESSVFNSRAGISLIHQNKEKPGARIIRFLRRTIVKIFHLT